MTSASPTSHLENAVIPPLIQRHIEDAGFYWNQIDTAAQSVVLSPDRLAHFNRLLDAHLEGLTVAGHAGLEPALAALQRWRKAGEAFACTWLVAHARDREAEEALFAVVAKSPDSLLRGVISGLAWAPAEAAAEIIGRWTRTEASAVQQVAALRALALPGVEGGLAASQPLDAYLASPDAHVRAAACRAIGASDIGISGLRGALQDAERAVRAEAAIALARRGDRQGCAAALWHCVAEQAAEATAATGWFRFQSQRRLERWVRHLAWLAPMGHADIAQLYEFLPPRAGLAFALYHGDKHHFSYVLARMAEPEHARLAGWVWQTLTGVDLRAKGLTLPEPEFDADTIAPAQQDADRGMPLPNVAAIMAYTASLTFADGAGARLLLGEPDTIVRMLALADHAPQAVWAVAAHALGYLAPEYPVPLRGPVARSRACLETLRDAVIA